jgi:hypothetical protein
LAQFLTQFTVPKKRLAETRCEATGYGELFKATGEAGLLFLRPVIDVRPYSRGRGSHRLSRRTSSGSAALLVSATRLDDEPLALFWSETNEDEEFAGLLASA